MPIPVDPTVLVSRAISTMGRAGVVIADLLSDLRLDVRRTGYGLVYYLDPSMRQAASRTSLPLSGAAGERDFAPGAFTVLQDEGVSALLHLIKDPDAAIRTRAVELAGRERLSAQPLLDAIIEIGLAKDTDPSLRVAAALAAIRIDSSHAPLSRDAHRALTTRPSLPPPAGGRPCPGTLGVLASEAIPTLERVSVDPNAPAEVRRTAVVAVEEIRLAGALHPCPLEDRFHEGLL